MIDDKSREKFTPSFAKPYVKVMCVFCLYMLTVEKKIENKPQNLQQKHLYSMQTMLIGESGVEIFFLNRANFIILGTILTQTTWSCCVGNMPQFAIEIC